MADAYYIDGQQLDASNFGETDDNGVWIPKKYLGTYGTNGFKLEFQQTGTGTASASTIGADTSGNDNHLTSNNLAAIDVTTDTPTNNFCTWNVSGANPNLAFEEGNTYAENNNSTNWRSALGTIGVSTGKWYWEFRGGPTGDSQRMMVGFTNEASEITNPAIVENSNGYPAKGAYGYGYRNNGEKNNNDSFSNYGSSWNSNTTIGIYLDLDNGTIGFIHGSDQGNAYTGITSGKSGFWFPFCSLAEPDNGELCSSHANFGNGAHSDFGTNTDANGYGAFSYSVPSGYYALCTKNLAEYG